MRTIPFPPSGELRGVPAIIFGNRDFATPRAFVDRHGDGPDAHLRSSSTPPRRRDASQALGASGSDASPE